MRTDNCQTSVKLVKASFYLSILIKKTPKRFSLIPALITLFNVMLIHFWVDRL